MAGTMINTGSLINYSVLAFDLPIKQAVSMSSTSEIAKPATVTPLPDLALLAGALGNPTRWKMLKELSIGEARSIGELATAAGCNYDNAGRHLAVFRKAGAVMQGRGRLYQIQPHHLPAPGERIVDFWLDRFSLGSPLVACGLVSRLYGVWRGGIGEHRAELA